jgi:hypothetical protein
MRVEVDRLGKAPTFGVCRLGDGGYPGRPARCGAVAAAAARPGGAGDAAGPQPPHRGDHNPPARLPRHHQDRRQRPGRRHRGHHEIGLDRRRWAGRAGGPRDPAQGGGSRRCRGRAAGGAPGGRGGAVWAATTAGRQLLRIDPRTARVTASLPVPAEAVAADGSGVWAVCCGAGARGGQLTRVDPASGRVTKVMSLPGHPYAVGTGPSGVWVLGAGGRIWRVDPASNRVVATIRLPSGVSFRGDGVDTGDRAVTSPSPRMRSGSATLRPPRCGASTRGATR